MRNMIEYAREHQICRIDLVSIEQFTDTGGGIKLRESRLFPTEEDAKKSTR